MKPGLSERRWQGWCRETGLIIYLEEDALFVSPWVYYGTGIRARPGTLIITATQFIHHSYSAAETFYAIGEPSIRVVVEVEDIAHGSDVRLGLLWSTMNGIPKLAVRLALRDRSSHDFILHDSSELFRHTVSELGIPWQKQPEPRRLPGRR